MVKLEFIFAVQDELNELGLPIEVVSENSLLVKTQSGDCIVTRQELRRYLLQEATSMSGARTLGGVCGDWRPMDSIAQDCAAVFSKIDGMKK